MSGPDSRNGRPWHTSDNTNNGTNGAPAAHQKSGAKSFGFSKMDLVRVLLFIFNVVFVLVGIAFVGIGIWTAVDKIYISSIVGDDLFSAASYMLIVVGSITIGICILGIYCIFKQKLTLTRVYFGLLIFASLFLVVIGITVVVFHSNVEGAMVNEMRETLINGYGADTAVTDAWDQVQSDLKCCAISQVLIGTSYSLYSYNYVDGSQPETEAERKAQDSWPIYKRTEFFKGQDNRASNEKRYVPPSCCVYDTNTDDYLNLGYCQNYQHGPPTNYASDSVNHYLYYEGCYEKAKTFILDQAIILIVMGFVFGLFMISGIVLTFLLMRHISNEKESETSWRREPDNL